MEETQKESVDGQSIPVCPILGVNIAAINMPWLMEYTKDNLPRLSGDYMCVSNVHTTVMSYDDEEYRAIQNGAALAIPDGGPLSSVGRKRGFKDMQRTTGPDYMVNIFGVSEERGYRHFFYGSTEQTLAKMKERLQSEYPDLQIAGMYSPPFGEVSKEEEERIIEMINSSAADFVWVGLGAPKQERWMAAHKGIIKGFMVGVGAAFDYYAGNIKRAPKWMQKANLEWLYRFFQSPCKLFKRYFYTNTKFIWNAVIRKK